ncbi:ABC transporter substrate-binding protein [Clostridium merdae]|uniref:ABC transporter substrate-binding protein n=1 Tax=Clostridium merdae TaxID=1958780 RepID=UPI000A26F99F|nr:ABC transporter substrate-binding protein [Clostridium merdae]
MKKIQKATAALLASLMLVSAAGCGGNTTPAASGAPSGSAAPASTDSAKTLRIYGWNTEFQERFNKYYKDAGKLPDGIKVEWVITPSENNAYQNKLDADLKMQDSAADKIDIFLIEADNALKYVDSDYTLDVKADIGLTDADMKDQFEYTKDITTDSKGKLKAVSWQATPGLFAYRRSIAKAVLGTDDPEKVQLALSDWDKFNATAKTAHDKGYKMLSGYDDSYRTFSNNISSQWVDDKDTIHIDPIMMKWVDQTKEFTDKSYNNKTSLWAPEWQADQGPNGKVFGFFYSTWGINFTLLKNALAKPVAEGGKEEVGNGIYGDYAVCQGPANYYWGGSWICGAKGTDNVDIVRDVMKTLTCDQATMKQITLDTEDFTNNQTAMGELAKSDYKSPFLGGQNHIALFAAAAPKINMKNLSKYDQGMTEEFQKAFKDYFDGNVSKDQALDNFYRAIMEKYPNLKRAS